MNLNTSQIPGHDCPRPATIAMEGYSSPGWDSLDRVVRVCDDHEAVARDHMDGLRPHRAIQGDPGHHVQCGSIADYR